MLTISSTFRYPASYPSYRSPMNLLLLASCCFSSCTATCISFQKRRGCKAVLADSLPVVKGVHIHSIRPYLVRIQRLHNPILVDLCNYDRQAGQDRVTYRGERSAILVWKIGFRGARNRLLRLHS
jgi:hypothetical protein